MPEKKGANYTTATDIPGKPVVDEIRRLVQWRSARLMPLVAQMSYCLVLNAVYIERLNGMLRAQVGLMVCRTPHQLHHKETLNAGMYLVGALNNVWMQCARARWWTGQQWASAAAAGITKHCWRVQDLL